MPTEPTVVETLSLQAEVVTVSERVASEPQVLSNQTVKLQLPDGMHAFVLWKSELPEQGDTVDVLVRVHEDGSRRVSLAH